VETPQSDIPWPHAATLVLAADTARQRRWAVSTAIDIIRKLADQHPKVVLADIQLRKPSSLAATLGIEEGPGIVDVLFRGASFSASAHKPEGESFYFLSIGTDPPPRQVLFAHPRWKKIADRLGETGAHLLPCVMAEDYLESGPIPGFEPCIVLNATGVDVELPEGARRIAEFLAPPEIRESEEEGVDLPAYVTGEPEAAPEPEPEAEVAAQPFVDGPREESPDQEPEPEPELPLEAEPEPESVGAAGSFGEEVEPDRDRAIADLQQELASIRPRQIVIDPPIELPPPAEVRRRPIIPAIAIGAALVAVVLFVVWRMFGTGSSPEEGEVAAAADTTTVVDTVPDSSAMVVDMAATGEALAGDPTAAPEETPEATPAVTPETEAAEASPPAEEPPAGSRRQEVALPYSVAIASYSSLDDAIARQQRWTSEEVPFYVAPTVVRGVVYYRVFAGILHDRDQAERLMAQLVDQGVKDQSRDWDVRPASLAFGFGSFVTAQEAGSAVATLASQGVPAYVVPAAGGAFYVYAGGYERASDAQPLLEHLQRAGLQSELVERVGLELP
jgi:cell division septation protein DedD